MSKSSIFEFYSVESQAVIRKRFVHVATHGELELYVFLKDADAEYATMFVKVSETRLLMARFHRQHVARSPEKIPTTLAAWREAVRDELLRWRADRRALPGDADQFGFTPDDIAAARAIYEQYQQERREAREQQDRKYAEHQAQKQAEHLASLRQKVSANEMISGSDLVDLARSLDIELHPRTVGTLRKRVVAVNADRARARGKGHLPPTVYAAYMNCVVSINASEREKAATA